MAPSNVNEQKIYPLPDGSKFVLPKDPASLTPQDVENLRTQIREGVLHSSDPGLRTYLNYLDTAPASSNEFRQAQAIAAAVREAPSKPGNLQWPAQPGRVLSAKGDNTEISLQGGKKLTVATDPSVGGDSVLGEMTKKLEEGTLDPNNPTVRAYEDRLIGSGAAVNDARTKFEKALHNARKSS